MRVIPYLLFVVSTVGLAAPQRGRLAGIAEYARERYVAPESCLETMPGAIPAHLRLSTARLTLRPLGVDDVPALMGVLRNEQVAAMSGDYLEESTILWIVAGGQMPTDTLEDGMMINFGVFEGERLIGMTQLVATNPEVALERGLAHHGERWVEISYHLHPDSWGRGYAQEITRATTALAFRHFHVDGIHAQAIEANTGSAHVLTRLGLTRIDTRDGNHFFAMRRP